jgi:GNAT superfamily N-acetyltransferase
MIREARPGDEDGLFSLVGELGHSFPPVRAAFDTTIASYFAGEHPSVFLLVSAAEGGEAENDGALQGYALTTIVPLLATNGPSAQLQELVVDASARGLDVGTQLVRAVEAECERRGVTQLTVASRRAGGFYDRLGFHESAEYMRRFF